MNRFQQVFVYFRETDLQPLNACLFMTCFLTLSFFKADPVIPVMNPDRSDTVHSCTHNSKVAKLLSSLAFAAMPASVHSHSIFLCCTPASFIRCLVSIFAVSSTKQAIIYRQRSVRM